MEVERRDKGKKRKVVALVGRDVRQEKKGVFGISHESRRQDLVSLFQNTRIQYIYIISVFSLVSSAPVVGATFLFKQFDRVTIFIF